MLGSKVFEIRGAEKELIGEWSMSLEFWPNAVRQYFDLWPDLTYPKLLTSRPFDPVPTTLHRIVGFWCLLLSPYNLSRLYSHVCAKDFKSCQILAKLFFRCSCKQSRRTRLGQQTWNIEKIFLTELHICCANFDAIFQWRALIRVTTCDFNWFVKTNEYSLIVTDCELRLTF